MAIPVNWLLCYTLPMARNWKVLFLSLLALTACSDAQRLQPQPQKDVSKMEVDEKGLSLAKATLTTAYGPLTIRFYPEKAPQTVARIAELIQNKFYDGLTFHRVVPNFVVQGGDPSGTGSGGSGQNLPAEFNDIPHIKGTVAMARKQDPGSGDCQFYIALSRLEHLDGQYTVFGQVVEGLEVVDQIRQGDKIVSFTLDK